MKRCDAKDEVLVFSDNDVHRSVMLEIIGLGQCGRGNELDIRGEGSIIWSARLDGRICNVVHYWTCRGGGEGVYKSYALFIQEI